MKLIPREVRRFVGMNDSASSTDEYGPGEVSLMKNVRPVDNGSLETMGGYRLMHAATHPRPASGSQLPSPGYHVSASSVDTLLVAFAGTKAYQGSNATDTSWTEVATGLTGAWWMTAQFNYSGAEWLFGCNGTNLIAYDGSTWSAWTNCPSGAKMVVAANDRLWVATGTDNVVYASKIGDPITFSTTSGGLEIRVGDSSPITSLGVLGAQIIVGKEQSTALIDGFGVRDLVVNAGARGASRSVGCVGRRTMISCGDHGLAWLSERGIELYRGPGSKIEQIGLGTLQTLRNAGWQHIKADPGIPFSTYYPTRDELWVTVPEQSASTSRITIVVNMRTGGSWVREWSTTSGGLPNHIVPLPPSLASTTTATPLFGVLSGGFPALFEIGSLDYAYNSSLTGGWVGSGVAGTVLGRHEEWGTTDPKRARIVHALGGYQVPSDLGEGDPTMTLGVRGQSTTFSEESVEFSASSEYTTDTRVTERQRVRVNARGPQIQFRAQLSPGQWLSTVRVDAEVLERGR